MTVASVPAGWYRDPSTRHEQRYWDGGRWSSHVLDGPVSGEDALGDQAVTSAVRFVPGVGYRAFRFPTWRRFLFILALVAVAVPLGVELMGAALTAALGPTPGAIEQWIFYWIYKPSADGSAMQVQPTLLWLGLVLAMVTMGVAMANRQATLLKAGGRVARLWSSREDKQRWHAGLDAMAAAGVGWTVRYRLRDWLFLAAGTLGSLIVLGIAANTIASRYGFSPLGSVEPGYRLALGPWLCLAAGIGGLVEVLVLLPWRLGHEIAVYPNGRVVNVTDIAPTVPEFVVDAALPFAGPSTQGTLSTPAATIAEIVEAAATQSAQAAESQDELRLAALREFVLSSKTPAQMGRRVGLKTDALAALLAQRELKFSSGASTGNTYTGADRLLWEANKQQLFDDLVADKGTAGVLAQAASVTPDWFNTAGGQLVANLADFGGLSMSLAAKDRTPISANQRRLAWIGFIFVAGLIGVTFGLAAPIGWIWQSSYFGWRNGSKAQPRAAIVLGWIGLAPVMLLLALVVFTFIIAPIALLVDAFI